MKSHQVLVGLTVTNCALLLLGVAQRLRPAIAASELPMLRGRGLEIVDDRGQPREHQRSAAFLPLPVGLRLVGWFLANCTPIRPPLLMLLTLIGVTPVDRVERLLLVDGRGCGEDSEVATCAEGDVRDRDLRVESY